MRFLIGLVLLMTMTASAAVNDADKELLDNHIEMLLNPGFENGRAQWTASGGTFATASSGTSLLSGRISGTWDSGSAGQTLCSSQRTIPEGAKGRPGIGSIAMIVPSGTSTHVLEVRDGSANVLATSGARSYAGGTSNSQRINTAVFSYPNTGTVRLCLVSVASDEPLVALDLATVRTEPWQLVALQGASLVASGFFPTTANCSWDTTATGALTAFNADSDCPAPTLRTNEGPGILLTTDTDLPQFTINNLPAGTCQVLFSGTITHTVAQTNASIGISDGTTTDSVFTTVTQPTVGNGSGFNALSTFRYTEAGNRTFSIRGRTVSGTQSVSIGTGFTSASPTLSFSIWCSPLQANQALRADQVGWKIDASMGGANAAIGTSAQTSYVGITNSSLDLVLNPGSATAEIACATTTAPSGLTCSGDESVGIAFTPPTSGDYLVCASFSHESSVSGGGAVATYWQLVETPINAQTISQEGKTRVESRNATPSGAVAVPVRLCGTFNFSSVSKKAIRLFYEQEVAATIGSNNIRMDRGTSQGQRDTHWEVYPVNPWLQSPVLTNSVISPLNGVTKVFGFTFGGASNNTNCTSTPCTVRWSTAAGDVTSVSRSAAGSYTVNFLSGAFSGPPACTASCERVGTGVYAGSTYSFGSSSGIGVICHSGAGGALADSEVQVTCIGPR